MADRLIKGMDPNPKRTIMLMNTWFNFYGSVVSILDLILILMGFELIILSVVNDFNSDIHNDISFHYHYGLIFAGFMLFVAALVGLLGFLSESLPKLCLSWALMVFVILMLIQSAVISQVYKQELSLLINSDAEVAFKLYVYNKKDEKYKRKTEAVMREYECCGWEHINEMLLNGAYPCDCCIWDKEEMDKCNESIVEEKFWSNQTCNPESRKEFLPPCQPKIIKVFSEDLTNIMTFIICTIFICMLTTVLTFVISNDLLKVHHD